MPIVVTPPAPAPEPLSESVSTSLTPTDKERVRQAAESAGVSMAAYVRAAILAKLDTTGVQ